MIIVVFWDLINNEAVGPSGLQSFWALPACAALTGQEQAAPGISKDAAKANADSTVRPQQ